jgi:hypothetical protein
MDKKGRLVSGSLFEYYFSNRIVIFTDASHFQDHGEAGNWRIKHP